jgi:S1-C subfamily serine protease
MGRFVLRGGARGVAGALALVGLLSCTNQSLVPVGQPSAALAAAKVSPSDSFGETLDIAGLQDRFAAVAQRIAPSVVAISATEATFNVDAALRADDLNPNRLATLLSGSDRTVGTGFIVDADGYILTNDHVVAHSEQLWVTTDDRKVYPAMVIGSDPRADLAVLKIPARNLPAVKWADPAKVKRGQWTIAIGNPYGLSAEGEMCMSVGVVSAIGRSLPKLSGKEDRLYSDLIQTTAQINPGNSGGPLFDINGDVIGINAAVILPQKQTNGIGFAIPGSPRVMRIIENLKQGGEVVYGYLGVKASTPTVRERRGAKIEGEVGAFVDSVESKSPAEAAGLKRGDIVVTFNGETITDGDHFIRVVGSAPVDDQGVRTMIVRGDKRQEMTIQLRRREIAAAAVTRDKQRLRWRGLLLGPIPANWSFADKKAPASGVMVLGVGADSPFAKDGVLQGSVITAIAGKPVAGITDLQSLLNDLPSEQCSVQLAGQDDSAVVSIRE